MVITYNLTRIRYSSIAFSYIQIRSNSFCSEKEKPNSRNKFQRKQTYYPLNKTDLVAFFLTGRATLRVLKIFIRYICLDEITSKTPRKSHPNYPIFMPYH